LRGVVGRAQVEEAFAARAMEERLGQAFDASFADAVAGR